MESKLNTIFVIKDEEKPKENPILSQIQMLINSGNGNAGRLQHIYDMLASDKPLYHSDQVYLENHLATNNRAQKNNDVIFDEKINEKKPTRRISRR